MIVCKSCGEPWELGNEVNDLDFIDFFSLEDRIYLHIADTKWDDMAAGHIPTYGTRQEIHDMIVSGQGCFSCGFDPMHKKSYGGALVVGDEVINYGKVHSISGDPPDPSVGIFGGYVEVTFLPKSWQESVADTVVIFDWDEEILVRRKCVL